MTQSDYKAKIGKLIQKSRQAKGFTQAHLAEALNTSQSAINRIEKGGQNISLEMLARISDVLSKELVSLNTSDKINFRVNGGKTLSGDIEIKTSKNAAVGLLCASLLNKGKTTLRRVPRIEEVNRLIEVLTSIGVKTKWLNEQNDLEIVPPKRLNLENMDISAAKRTRSIIMFLGPLLHQYNDFKIPFAGGCSLGTRTVEPHMSGLRPFGLGVKATNDEYYHAVTQEKKLQKHKKKRLKKVLLKFLN
jgi:UDP-N-acetylglucosamine 1-carboxyvinyltransferase